MRNELKFKSDYIYLKSEILGGNFNKHHQNRVINSIYLDNHDLDLFKQGEEGTVPRFKLRYRWYGNKDFSSKGTFEKKITYENYREKISVPIKFCEYPRLSDFASCNFGHILFPTIKVSYKREYFIDYEFNRITLDSEIEYTKLNEFGSLNYSIKENSSILEMKLDINKDENNILPRVHNLRTRFSKYCEGVRNCLSQE